MKELTKEQLEQVKAEHPSWFEPNIEVGKWYNLNHGKCLMFVTGLSDKIIGGHKTAIGYGFNYKGDWVQDGQRWGMEGATEADDKEVEFRLIEYANKIYKTGDVVSGLGDFFVRASNNMTLTTFFNLSEEGNLWAETTNGWYAVVFHKGEWAPVISTNQTSLQDDIQALKDRWPDINFTVIAEGKK